MSLLTANLSTCQCLTSFQNAALKKKQKRIRKITNCLACLQKRILNQTFKNIFEQAQNKQNVLIVAHTFFFLYVHFY